MACASSSVMAAAWAGDSRKQWNGEKGNDQGYRMPVHKFLRLMSIASQIWLLQRIDTAAGRLASRPRM